MNLSVVCVLVAMVSGCVWGLPENAQATGNPQPVAQPEAAAADAAAATGENDPARDKRWYLRHHYGGAFPGTVPGTVAVPVPVPVPVPVNDRRFYSNSGDGAFPVAQPVPVPVPVPQSDITPSLRSRAPASPSTFSTYDPRYRTNNHPAFNHRASFSELLDHQRRQDQFYQQQEQQFFQQQQQQQQQFYNKRYPDVVDTQGRTRNYFP